MLHPLPSQHNRLFPSSNGNSASDTSSDSASSTGSSASSSPPLSLTAIGSTGGTHAIGSRAPGFWTGRKTSQNHPQQQGNGYATPQEYLNNPMFESLNRNRNFWLKEAAERTIVLRPLSNLARKKNFHKRSASSRGACKVL